MKNREVFKLISTLEEHIRKRDAARAAGGQTDPRVLAAMERGMRAVRELDPIVRENCRDDPAALAEWDAIMRNFHDLEEVDSEGA
ncbi:MAG: hypothetical protein ABW208_13730, partial [Pyrinomonadaceae bacterium]